MKLRTTLIVCASLCAIAGGVLFAADEKIAENKDAEKKAGFVILFDGEKLSPEIWQGAIDGYPIEDGVIVCRKGGNLLTKKEYGNFHLRFEFRLPAGGNNGLGVRAAGVDSDAAYNGMELQILDNFAPQYANLKPYQYHGSIYGVVPSKRNADKNDYLKPVGEWNREEVIADGTKIKVILNDEVIVDADIAEFRDKPTMDGNQHPGLFREKGFVGFLGHGDPVAFRNVRIRELKTEKAGH
ncbi:MAG: 3-keto-disaccharide hydrolase [Thermoguttaceae bacterium]